ncbi:MAG: M6 family metalloprotease domain-containing protein [Chloroflexi bacterium]|nr:M6 family metalloprotease domain-containing protein [Chloroflexota bacterium]
MKKEGRIHPYLLAVIFVAVIALAAGPSASGAPASSTSWLGIMPPSPKLLERVKRGEAQLPQVITSPELRRSLGVNQPTEQMQPSGSWRAIALLVEFTDSTSSTSATYFDSLLFSTGTGTLKDYYNEVSYGILDIVTVNLPSSAGWMTMPQTYAYYVSGNNGFGTYPRNAQRLAEDAVWAANPVVNYANYDNDGDGYVESLFIIHAGSGAEFTGSPNDIWSHRWSMLNDPSVDGVILNNYTMEPEYWVSPGDMTVGVYAHELAHAFGLPDLYDTDNSSEGIGRWAMMGSGSWNGPLGSSPAWFSAWSRAFLGFVSPTNVVANATTVSIPAAETSQTVYRLWTDGAGGNEYFLVENRQPVGYDAALPGFGLLIWHIDNGKNSNHLECNELNNWNCGANHLWVALEQADGLFDLENDVNRGDNGDPYPGSTNNRDFDFSTASNSSSYYHSSDTCVGVNNISSSAATMTADLSVACQANPVTAEFSGTPTVGTETVTVNFTNLSTGDVDTCLWDFGDGETSTSCGDPVHTYTVPRLYTVSLTVNGFGSDTSAESKTDYIKVYAAVSADFRADDIDGAAPHRVNFTYSATGSVDTCFWDFGDGTSTTCENVSHTYSSAGIYTVSLTVNGLGGDSDTKTKVGYVSVYDPVTANFNSIPTIGPTPLMVNFTNNSNGDVDTCLWAFGDGNTSNNCENPSHTYLNIGNYTVSLTVTGLGGDSNTKTRSAYIVASEPASAAFSGSPVAGLAPLTVDFTNSSTGGYNSCLWTFGDGNSSTDCNDPSHTYSRPGVYSVSLEINGSGGHNAVTFTELITVYDPVVADFRASATAGSQPLLVNFTNLSRGDYNTCLWDFGDGNISNLCDNQSHVYTAPGAYPVELTISGPGGSDSKTKFDYIVVKQHRLSLPVVLR